MEVFFGATDFLDEVDDETAATILHLALEEVEGILKVTLSSDHEVMFQMMRDELLQVISRRRLAQSTMDDVAPSSSSDSSSLQNPPESDEDELVEILRDTHVRRRSREVSGSGRLTNACTTRVESAFPVHAREPANSSQRIANSKSHFIFGFLDVNICPFQSNIKLE
jgi:hypothetical protein